MFIEIYFKRCDTRKGEVCVQERLLQRRNMQAKKNRHTQVKYMFKRKHSLKGQASIKPWSLKPHKVSHVDDLLLQNFSNNDDIQLVNYCRDHSLGRILSY